MYGETQGMQATALGRVSAPQIPDLGRIKSAVERVAKARSDIECFLGRYNGESVCRGGGIVEERDSNYRNDLHDLFEQLDRLEAAVSDLGDIG